MKYKKIILGVALALACFSSLNANALTETKVKKTETQAAAPNVYWTDGYGRVSYTTNSIISPVVKIALKEFAGDMKAQHPTFIGPTATAEYLIPPTLSFRR